jgi:uncharacterized peroxidase-related enzyme
MDQAELVSDEQAEGKVADIYDEIRDTFGMVPNFFRAQAAQDADWLELNWRRWQHIMGRQGALDRKTRELIALTVAELNDCEYCRNAHEAMALMSGADRAEVTEAKEVMELFASFTTIADSLDIPVDVTPESVAEH